MPVGRSILCCVFEEGISKKEAWDGFDGWAIRKASATRVVMQASYLRLGSFPGSIDSLF